jgi:hypothetical protein
LVGKEAKDNRKTTAKATTKELDEAKEKEVRGKWANERMANPPSAREALHSATFVWKWATSKRIAQPTIGWPRTQSMLKSALLS